jgi:hypothetical protein
MTRPVIPKTVVRAMMTIQAIAAGCTPLKAKVDAPEKIAAMLITTIAPRAIVGPVSFTGGAGA